MEQIGTQHSNWRKDMQIPRWFTAFLLALSCLAIPAPSYAAAFVGISSNTPPPVLPIYTQPPAPGPNFIWVPGHWAWGQYGYHWVAGRWVLPPQLGLLWTPGYWGWNPVGYYVWHPGYWARQVGFYGGINYGFGYFGRGYVGGNWFGNVFRYNTAVTNVNTTIVHNVYIDRTVVVNNTTINRVSYNGGTGGIVARPDMDELAVRSEPHFATNGREFSPAVDHGQPSQVSADRPISAATRPNGFAPVRPQSQAVGQRVRQVASRQARSMRRPAPAARPQHTTNHAPVARRVR
jgi:WXXGXW repeat (2 copies)